MAPPSGAAAFLAFSPLLLGQKHWPFQPSQRVSHAQFPSPGVCLRILSAQLSTLLQGGPPVTRHSSGSYSHAPLHRLCGSVKLFIHLHRFSKFFNKGKNEVLHSADNSPNAHKAIVSQSCHGGSFRRMQHPSRSPTI